MLTVAVALTLLAQTAAEPAERPAFQHVDPKDVDPSVDPCTDFYAYACNGWIKRNPIPADKGRWGTGGHLALANQFLLRDILEAASQPHSDRSVPERQIGDDYAACMDEHAIDKHGISPLRPLLQRIDRMKSIADLPDVLAEIHLATFNMIPGSDSGGFTPFFSFSGGQDLDDATLVVAQVDQGGLGLPDRDYYLKMDAKSVETRAMYLAHIAKMLKLAGRPQATAEARQILDLETALAIGSMDLVKRRDPANLNHKMSLEQLQGLTPDFDWKTYVTDIGMPPTAHYLVATPDFFTAFEEQLKTRSLDGVKAYLRWHLIRSTASLLPKAFLEEDFAFYGKHLGGAKEIAPRWKRCSGAVDRDLGEALGAVFVEKAFPPSSKERMDALVSGLIEAMSLDIAGLEWMGPDTRKQAEIKLRAIYRKIGYPDHPRDYSSVKVTRDGALANAMGLNAFELHRQLNKIGKPVDKQEWGMTAPTVNAYYDPQMNTINFPAGILQPPYFDATMDEAVNYGAIGSIIGHEMTHGFDDQGAKFDATGNLHDWWSAEDGVHFRERVECLANEYSGFTVLDGLHVDGHLTLGENTADNGGILISHAAWVAARRKAGHPVTDEDEKRFFLSYAQAWCSAYSDPALRLLVQTNPHSPPHFRVNGVLRNVADFQRVYACKVGSAMAPEKPCRVW